MIAFIGLAADIDVKSVEEILGHADKQKYFVLKIFLFQCEKTIFKFKWKIFLGSHARAKAE